MKNNFAEKFSEAYKKLYSLHPQQEEDIFNLRYLHVKWFFSNHLHNVLKNIVVLKKKYYPKANTEAALYGGLFHDAGLVYKRDIPSPAGHENRSIEFASVILKELDYDNNFINLVCECIKATEPEYDSLIPEAIIVKNADTYSHLTSMHFFAKANFAKDIYSYIPWFEKKIEASFRKLTIPDLVAEVGPIYNSYKKMVENYKTNKSERDNIIKKLLDIL
jgi:HD superfamily phosphodiesterase